MNFRPHKRKIITSLIALFLSTLLMSCIFAVFLCWSSAPLCTEDYCPPYDNPCHILNPVIIFFSFFLAGIPAFVIIYVVYSLIEKKKK